MSNLIIIFILVTLTYISSLWGEYLHRLHNNGSSKAIGMFNIIFGMGGLIAANHFLRHSNIIPMWAFWTLFAILTLIFINGVWIMLKYILELWA